MVKISKLFLATSLSAKANNSTSKFSAKARNGPKFLLVKTSAAPTKIIVKEVPPLEEEAQGTTITSLICRQFFFNLKRRIQPFNNKNHFCVEPYSDGRPFACSLVSHCTPSSGSSGAILAGNRPFAGRAPLSSGQGNVTQIFKVLQDNIDETIVKKTQAVIQFDLSGGEVGKWFLDLKNGKGSCGSGQAQSPDATVTLTSQSFVEIFSGKTKPSTAYILGKMKVKGDTNKVLKLENFIRHVQPKMPK